MVIAIANMNAYGVMFDLLRDLSARSLCFAGCGCIAQSGFAPGRQGEQHQPDPDTQTTNRAALKIRLPTSETY